MPFTKKKAIRFLRIPLILLGILAFLAGLFLWTIRIPEPTISESQRNEKLVRIQTGHNSYRVNNSWLRKNEQGIWEMYLEGSPYERGRTYGLLAKELVERQEIAFVDQIKEMIPSQNFLKFLKYFIGWFNRNIDEYIPQENKLEIYGISKSFSAKFDFIGPNYFRILNYHAAHDIGHALLGLNIVGCTSFAVNNALSADSSLLLARNFDFNMGDKFAEDKVLLFMKPDSGYAFASYSWAGFTGIVSGINEKGLTITLNAAKSDIPYSAKEPVSLLAREIIQYASDIDEAVAIAKKRHMFVSESLLIGSARDNKAVIIEKTPTRMDVYDSGSDLTVCANHYQGELLKSDNENIKNIKGSDSKARFDRMTQLLKRKIPVDQSDAAEILRDKLTLNDQFVGYGNPKSLNQLLAHHGIVFKPQKAEVWISTQPYQIGSFSYYNLKDVFAHPQSYFRNRPVDKDLPADPFLNTEDYQNFEEFKKVKQRIMAYTMAGRELELSEPEIRHFVANNPKSYLPYYYLGNYFEKKGQAKRAIFNFQLALTHSPSSLEEATLIKSRIRELGKQENK